MAAHDAAGKHGRQTTCNIHDVMPSISGYCASCCCHHIAGDRLPKCNSNWGASQLNHHLPNSHKSLGIVTSKVWSTAGFSRMRAPATLCLTPPTRQQSLTQTYAASTTCICTTCAPDAAADPGY
jgi:hypothetical protein